MTAASDPDQPRRTAALNDCVQRSTADTLCGVGCALIPFAICAGVAFRLFRWIADV